MMIGALRVALQFLTRIPIPGEPPTARELSAAYYFYPIIGLLLATAAILLRFALAIFFPPSFSLLVVLVFLMWITGGLHEDGLADVADGMAGGWTIEDRLRIMKDSRLGSFGTLALVIAVLAKYVALSSMNPLHIDGALVASQVLGRWSFLPLGFFNPPAREGLGSQFMKGLSARPVVVTTAFSILVVTVVAQVTGAVSFCVATAVVASASSYFRRRLGGITGDCFGATFEFVEIATYATFLA